MDALKIKVVTEPWFVSFTLITQKWIQYMNLRNDVYATMQHFTDKRFKKTDITILHEAVAVLEHFKPDKQRDGLIVCAEVSDTDRVSEKMANILNENCDLIITPTEFSAWGLKRGGVYVPIHVVPHGCDLPVIERSGEKRIGFYVSTTNEQFVRKGSYIALDIMSKLNYPKVVKVFPDFVDFKIPNAEILGKLENMMDFYKRIAIYVLPILGGAFELTALEALYTGVVTITTDHPIFSQLPTITVKSVYINRLTLPPHLLEYHIGGGYVPDTEDLINKIHYVYNNYEKELDKLKKILPKLRKVYHWQNVIEKMIKLLNDYI